MHKEIQGLGVKSGRREWLDMLRALAMFFVVLVHASMGLTNWWIYNVFIGPIMLPLFFAISGYLFNSRNGDSKAFLVNLLKRKILPWLGVSLIWLRIIMLPRIGWKTCLKYCWSIISGNELWFMPALIISEVIFFYILKISKKTVNICVMSVLGTITGFLMDYLEIGNFAMLNRAFIAQIFLLIGYLFKYNQDKLEELDVRLVCGGAMVSYLALGIVSLYFFPEEYVDVHLNMYQSIPLCFLMSYIGCICLLTAASRVKHVSKILCFLGQNTLVCYAFHMYAFRAVNKCISILGIQVDQSWGWAIIKTCMAMGMCAALSLGINYIVHILKRKTVI